MGSKLKLLVGKCDVCGLTMEYAAVTGIGSVMQPGIGDCTQLDRQPLATAADISVAATNLALSAGSEIRCTNTA